jgi:hypothetical protein
MSEDAQGRIQALTFPLVMHRESVSIVLFAELSQNDLAR